MPKTTMRASERARLQPMKLGETARMNSPSLYRLVFRLQAETAGSATSERRGRAAGERAQRAPRTGDVGPPSPGHNPKSSDAGGSVTGPVPEPALAAPPQRVRR